MSRHKRERDHLIVLLLCLFAFFSCEWDGGNNFHELEKKDINDLSIELEGYNLQEIIELSSGSSLVYALTDTSYFEVSHKAYLDDEELYFSKPNEILISAPTDETKIYTLKLVLQIADKSLIGQLAAYQNTGIYEGEFSFLVKIVKGGENRLQVRQSLSEENNLRIEWDAPLGIDFEKFYVIDKEQYDTLARITDLNKLYYIDKDYCYGIKEYKIVGVPRSKNHLNYSAQFAPVYESVVVDVNNIAISEDNHFVFTWSNPNPYPAKYLFIPNESQTKLLVDDNSLKLNLPRPNTAFPVTYYPVRMYLLPEQADVNDYQQYKLVEFILQDPKLEDNTMLIGNYAFYPPNNLYCIGFGKLNVYNTAKNMELVQSTPVDISNTGAQVKVSRTGIVAIYNGLGKVELYSDASLTKSLLKFSDVLDFNFGGDILIIRHRDNGAKIVVYNIHTLQPVIINGIDDYANNNLYLSPDGKYLFAVRESISQLKLEGNNLTKMGTINMPDNNYFNFVYFNEVSNNEAIVNAVGMFEIRNIHTLELIKRVNGDFFNVDPVTGYLLYCSSGSSTFSLLNSSNDQIVANIGINLLGASKANIFNNILIYNSFFVNYNSLKNK